VGILKEGAFAREFDGREKGGVLHAAAMWRSKSLDKQDVCVGRVKSARQSTRADAGDDKGTVKPCTVMSIARRRTRKVQMLTKKIFEEEKEDSSVGN
jgi:hypothetical protein